MRSHPKASVLVVALLALLAIAAPAANAAYTQIGQIGGTGPDGENGSGSEDGQFSNPNGADVNDASGVLYVADTGNDRVQSFTPTKTAGEFSATVAVTAPTAVAVDQTDGSVYVAHASGISKFTAALSPAAGWSDPGVTGALAVDPTTGDLLVADQGANLIRRYESDGTADGTFPADRPLDVAVDSSGDVLVVTSTGDILGECDPTSSVVRYSGAGVEEGTIGSLTAPGQVDVDPDGDAVVVAAPVNGYNCGSTVPSAVFFDSAGNETRSYELPNATYGLVPGLAARGDGSERVYAVLRSPVNDQWVTTRVSVLDEVFPPEATIDPVTTVSGTEAELSGTVDANGEVTEYRFEISADGGSSWSSLGSESAGEGTDPVVVEDTAPGLDPNTAYQARLLAISPGGEAIAGPESFQTLALPPTVVNQNASTTLSEATLRAQITTGGANTTYRFEYGPTSAYGKSTVVKTAKGASGESAVSARILNLTPGATYHFRVVVENSEGADEGDDQTFTLQTPPGADTCPNAASRAQQGSQYLPECRAYEMVSPLEKNGADISYFTGSVRASLSGDLVSFMSTGNFDSAGTGQNGLSTYLYDRGDGGWDGEGISIYQDSDYRNGAIPGKTNTFPALSEDLEHGIINAREPFPDTAANTPGIRNLFAWERATDTFRVVSPNQSGNSVAPSDFNGSVLAGATPNFAHVVFNSRLNLTAGATGSNPKAYHWHDGSLELAGIFPGPGATPSTFSVIGAGAAGDTQDPGSTAGHAISNDGTKVFFTDVTNGAFGCGPYGACPGPIYLRENGEKTILINGEENPSEDVPLGQAQFLRATPDGSAVFLLSRQRLVAADQDTEGPAGADLYRYDTTVAPDEPNLTLVSDPTVLPAPGTSIVGQGGVLGILGASEDGSRAYFAYVTEGGSGNTKEVELWAYDEGSLRKAADLWGPPGFDVSDRQEFEWGAPTDIEGWQGGTTGQPWSTAVVTADGRFLLFLSQRRQPGSFDNANTAQLYLYDAEDGSTTCASCNPGSDHAEWSAVVVAYNPYLQFASPARHLSADGSKVFFHTREKLVARDANDRMDPYVYDVATGRHSLLASGTGTDRSFFMGASEDGDTAFVLSRDRLLGSDRDNLRDLYAVRVNGGFPEPPPEPAPCEGDACQVPGPPPHTAIPAGSNTIRGGGNLEGQRNCSRPARKVVKAKQRLSRADGKAQKAKAKRAIRKARAGAKSCRRGASK